MKLEVFEVLFGINKGLDEAIGNLESLSTIGEFKGESVEKFLHDAERLKAGINRYLAEQIQRHADEEAARLDEAVKPEAKEKEEE